MTTTRGIGTCRQRFEISRCTNVLFCVMFGVKLDTDKEEGEEVSEDYKTGSFVICAAVQTVFV